MKTTKEEIKALVRKFNVDMFGEDYIKSTEEKNIRERNGWVKFEDIPNKDLPRQLQL